MLETSTTTAPEGADVAAAPASAEAADTPPAAPQTNPLEEAERLKGLGNAAFQAGNHAEAIKLYSGAIAAAGDAALPVYFSNRAVCRAALEEWEGAREDAAEALSRPGAPPTVLKKALYQRARAEVRLHRLADAEETLTLASQHGLRQDVEKLLKDEGLSAAAPAPPGEASALAKEAGTTKYKEGNYKEALTEYKKAVDLLPADADAPRRALLLGNVAAACLMLRRATECVSSCDEALNLDPANSKIRGRKATAQVGLGEFAGARETLGTVNGDAALANVFKLIEDSERDLAAADAVFAGGKAAQALSMFSDLETKALFSFPPLALRMGRCYLELKAYPRVLNTTQQVLRANPRNVDALVLRTEALYRNNNNEVAVKQWLDPFEQGQKLLKEALSFDPDHSGAQGLRKRLRKICDQYPEMKQAFDNREFDRAKEVLDTMIELCHDNPVVLGNLYCERAKAGVRLKDWRQVVKDVGQATYRNHELVQAYLFRAQAMQALDRHEDACKELESLLQWHRTQAVYDKLQEAKFTLRKTKRPDFYELLQVPTVASQLEIKKAYRERAAEWHPDKKGHLDEVAKKNAEEMFKRIGQAYEVLTDAQKKELYDKGYDNEGIEEQIELKKRRTQGHCGPHGCGPGGCH